MPAALLPAATMPTAITEGVTMTDVEPRMRSHLTDLEAKYTADEGEFFLTGIQALVRLPMEQLRVDAANGLRTAAFISGYQGSPLGTYDLELKTRAKLLERMNIVHQPGLNEELGATAVMGSQLAQTFDTARYDGVLGVWYGKAPGLDRASDAIRHANYAGTARFGGVLALSGDDPANKSSTLPSRSEQTLEDLAIPTIFPGNVQEILDFGRHAIALSRLCGLWTALKIVTAVADGAGSAELHPGRIAPVLPTIEYNGMPYVPQVRGNFISVSNDIEAEIYGARLPLAELYAASNPALNEITVSSGDDWIGIVSSGQTYYEVVEALRKLGLDDDGLRRNGIRLLRMGMVNPVERGIVQRFARGLQEILVVEEKRPYLENHVRSLLYGSTDAPRVVGKMRPDGRPLVKGHGTLDADSLAGPLIDRLGERLEWVKTATAAKPEVVSGRRGPVIVVPSRTPFVCSGCPHSTGLKAPKGALVGAGIGCGGLVGLMDPERVGTVVGATQMGGEGSQWIGIEPFVDTDHLFQNVGDGTYFHSGALAVRAAVAAKSHITYKILYNSAVAMTGGQDAPGSLTVPDLAATLAHEGVAKVIVTSDDPGKYRKTKMHQIVDVWDRSRIIEAQELLREIPGVTVLIHDQQCAAEKRRDRRRGRVADPALRVVINERVCEGCGDCGQKSNCLSVQPIDTEFGRKTQIHQSSCNKDYTCLDGHCPSFLTVVPRKAGRFARSTDPETTRREGGGRRRPALDAAELPVPSAIVPADDFTVRMPGIGGTGVVTVSQILGTAAMLDGRHVWGLDQTGLSQKAGPVVSDLRISREPVQGTNKVTEGQVDTYLAFDLLVAIGPVLAGASRERTVAIVSTTDTPTGSMVTDPRAKPVDQAVMRAQVDACTRSEHNLYVDAARVALGLFGDTTTTNVLLLGVAHQRGCLPVAAEAIEQAIELNGAAVETNKLAFRWGRMLVTDPSRVEAAMVTAHGSGLHPTESDVDMIGDLDHGTLGHMLRVRVPNLVAYQSRAYARRYMDVVRRVAEAEAAAVPGRTNLAEAVAGNLYKLMAYKDEYEVARLHFDEAALAKIRAEVGDDVKVSFNLQPPFLTAMGIDRKIRLGPWFAPALRALHHGKRLRGTPLDPFGYAHVRRLERRLIDEYRELVLLAADRVTPETHETTVELAMLPDLIRGYEHVKLANVERYRAEVDRVRGELGL
jgi:indolepyruvate ferredoxin oxidoreductase